MPTSEEQQVLFLLAKEWVHSGPPGILDISEYVIASTNGGDGIVDGLRNSATRESVISILSKENLRRNAAPAPTWIWGLIGALEESALEGRSLHQVAEDFDISPAYLSRRFKKMFGFGPSAYRKERILRRAIQRLRNGERPAAVAAALG